ncbi:hypothetical protein OPT61_g9928 [Boeremia exigua]|uniref:Uncharacterized protein n=1 Tax=Boeremia exigua TaxID=749465 RepID=A0ACC2HS16_9PLEO|nr:hypothetical protein OPT61_g9928 [Boeremia exigua]
MDVNNIPIPQTSPKRRKRTSDAGTENKQWSAEPVMHARRLDFSPVQIPAMRDTTGVSQDKAEQVLSAGTPERPEGTTVGDTSLARQKHGEKAKEDLELQGYLLKAMTTAQQMQTRACANIDTLTDKLHGWARHLDTQERWLHQERLRLIEQQQALTKEHLDLSAACFEKLDKENKPSKKPNDASKQTGHEDVQQLKAVIEILQGNIEILVSELQIEREARNNLEEKLRVKKNAADPTLLVIDDLFTPSP